jgi:hypothetical protein
MVEGALLSQTLNHGGSRLNIIFAENLRKIKFDFNKFTACNEPF